MAEELPAAVVIGVGNGMAFRQDGEVGREERAACRLDKGEDFVCRFWAVGRAGGLGHAFVLSIVQIVKEYPSDASRLSPVCDVKVLVAPFFKSGV